MHLQLLQSQRQQDAVAIDETTLLGEATLFLSCSWCADDVALGMVHYLMAFVTSGQIF